MSDSVASNSELYELEESILLKTFGNTPELRIVDFLLDNPRFDFSRKEIREAISSTKRTLSDKIPKLENLGIIKESRKIGKSTLYKINLENETVKCIRMIERNISLKIVEDELKKDEKEKLIVA